MRKKDKLISDIMKKPKKDMVSKFLVINFVGFFIFLVSTFIASAYINYLTEQNRFEVVAGDCNNYIYIVVTDYSLTKINISFLPENALTSALDYKPLFKFSENCIEDLPNKNQFKCSCNNSFINITVAPRLDIETYGFVIYRK